MRAGNRYERAALVRAVKAFANNDTTSKGSGKHRGVRVAYHPNSGNLCIRLKSSDMGGYELPYFIVTKLDFKMNILKKDNLPDPFDSMVTDYFYEGDVDAHLKDKGFILKAFAHGKIIDLLEHLVDSDSVYVAPQRNYDSGSKLIRLQFYTKGEVESIKSRDWLNLQVEQDALPTTDAWRTYSLENMSLHDYCSRASHFSINTRPLMKIFNGIASRKLLTTSDVPTLKRITDNGVATVSFLTNANYISEHLHDGAVTIFHPMDLTDLKNVMLDACDSDEIRDRLNDPSRVGVTMQIPKSIVDVISEAGTPEYMEYRAGTTTSMMFCYKGMEVYAPSWMSNNEKLGSMAISCHKYLSQPEFSTVDIPVSLFLKAIGNGRSQMRKFLKDHTRDTMRFIIDKFAGMNYAIAMLDCGTMIAFRAVGFSHLYNYMREVYYENDDSAEWKDHRYKLKCFSRLGEVRMNFTQDPIKYGTRIL